MQSIGDGTYGATYLYDGDGVRVRQLVNGVATYYFMGGAYEVTGTISGSTFSETGSKNYYAIAGQLIASDNGSGLQYFLTDHLGSIVAVLSNSGALLSQQRYMPFGQVRNSIGSITQTDFGYTGQRNNTYINLLWYSSRHYDPELGSFIQPDTIVPPGVQGLDRYAYVNNNPVNFTDPSGHMADDGNRGGGSCDSKCMNRSRQNYLFSLAFIGTRPNGTWTASDWKRYNANRDKFWAQPNKWDDSSKSWETFAMHVERLASHYDASQKDQFVRDFALLFGGVSYDDLWTQAAMDSAGGPEIEPIMNEGSQGLNSDYTDTLDRQDSQAHHYAGIFFLAYYAEAETGFTVNLGRDIFDKRGINYGDINLGTQAAIDAYYFRYNTSDLSILADYIRSLINP